MYVKSMVLEGFKSYGKRIEINGFDKEFNAITGFNGTGKSNILDAICFVLGITNLGQVRATSLQELVYKSGQAGVKKASVTITFDNRDRGTSPPGYEDYEEITVTRQIVIDGKNKYMINGSNVPNKRVQDMFCSVQLNVNNPHFLIMQGRITKVLSMKPLEILSMIEEAAGTKMYETKKQAALNTIQKKDSKLKEIIAILTEEIGPKIAKLKEERTQYIEFQRIERELEHCRKIVVAWKYLTALSNSEKAEGTLQTVNQQIEGNQQKIVDGKSEIATIEEQLQEIVNNLEAEKGDKMAALEHALKDAEKRENKLTAEMNSNGESIKAGKKEINQLKANTSDDENVLAEKEKELENVGGLFKKLKEQDETDTAAVLVAQEQFQKVSSGLLKSASGENATLEQQIISAKHIATEAQTEVKQCEMNMKHIKKQLASKQEELSVTDKDYRQDNNTLESKEKELKTIENEMKKLNYREGSREALENEKRNMMKEVKNLQERVDQFESRHPQLRFEYRDPEPNFRKDSVKGLVCKLIALKDKNAAYALDVAAGGKLYNVIVDTETTSKALLQRGQLQQRVTIIPLNKIDGRAMDQRTVELAQKLVGKENVEPALSLIKFPESTRKAMAWIFGQIFVVKDMESAKKIAFHDKIMKKCVTLEGDVFDPAGTLTGGAQSKTGSVLLKIEELKALQEELSQKEQKLRDIQQQIANIAHIADKFTILKHKFDLRTHEVLVLKQRLHQTSHHKVRQEIECLTTQMQELTKTMEVASATEKENTKRLKDLEFQLKDAANIREKQLEDAENQLKILQKKSENSRKEWKEREQESETLNLEITEIRKAIEMGKEQVVKAEEKLVMFEEKAEALKSDLNEAKEKVKEIQESVKAQKDVINQQNKEIQKLVARKEVILKLNTELELEIQKLNHEINSIKTSAADCRHKLSDLMRKYEWIEQDKAYFGKAGGIYDFEANDPEEIKRKMHQLESVRERLSRNVNTRAMNLLNKEEEQYNEMQKKKKIVEDDRVKILETIKTLDAKKKETLLQAWEQVNKDFGSIFSSLLPGANAKIQPPPNKTVLDGLEVKVGFAGAYKESLGELSGGQRSLVALSLILAMLLFKPAPLYILDEVDAALDLSHTENIGIMLKRHFKRSQFVVVSLKDGMFNNANVLFKTRFVDGMSAITRTERARNK